MSRAICRVLTLEQGATDKLCQLSPRELLQLVFDVFEDKAVLDDYQRARAACTELVRQVLTRVEVPNALPVILGGVRNAALQVVATVTVVAYINLGGLGRYLIDGLAVRDYDRMLGSVVLVAVLALVVDAVLALAQRLSTSPGLRLAAP